jgi:VanZ family protein
VAYDAEMPMPGIAHSAAGQTVTPQGHNQAIIAPTLVRRLSGWLPVILATLLIFWLSSRPYTAYFAEVEGPSYRLFQAYLQYPAHLIEYTILGLLWMWPLSRHTANRRRAGWLAFGAVVITAFLDESIQWCVPTRHFALRDLVMDSAGGMAATVASRWILPASGQWS